MLDFLARHFGHGRTVEVEVRKAQTGCRMLEETHTLDDIVDTFAFVSAEIEVIRWAPARGQSHEYEKKSRDQLFHNILLRMIECSVVVQRTPVKASGLYLFSCLDW